MKIKQIIIHGGGTSINEIIKLNLWDKLKGSFVIGTNFSFKDFLPTALCCCDFKFYSGKIDPVITKNEIGAEYAIYNTYNHKFRKELEHLPLIIAPNRTDMQTNITHIGKSVKMKNTIFLPYINAHTYYKHKDNPDKNLSKKIGFIDQTGMWAIGVACALKPEEIYLLGIDFCVKNNKCHYYNHTQHRGTLRGSFDWYRRHRESVGTDYYFKPFINDNPEINFYNVSAISKIKCFPKITPEEFLSKIEKPSESQRAFRKFIRKYFSKLYHQ